MAMFKKYDPSDPLNPNNIMAGHRGASLGPGAYNVNSDLIKKTFKIPKKGVAFGGSETRFIGVIDANQGVINEFLTPKFQEGLKEMKESDVQDNLKILKVGPDGNKETTDVSKPLAKEQFKSYTIGNTGKILDSKIRDFSYLKMDLEVPGPGIYDLPGAFKNRGEGLSSFFQSGSRRLAKHNKGNLFS
jgi:hypothetical protein